MNVAQLALLIVSSALLVNNVDALMKLNNFREKIEPVCFLTDEQLKNDNREKIVFPFSIEAFIGLVEKLERFPKPEAPRLNTMGVIRELLTNFRYDDLEYDTESKSFGTRGLIGVTKSHEITQLIFRDMAPQVNMEEVFTIDERCTLFFMISHTVNTTFRPDEESETTVNTNRKRAKYPVEQGVLSLASDQNHAFGIGKVLLGMLAGMKAQGITSTEIFALLKSNMDIPLQLDGDIIDPIYAVTFGDIISVPYGEGHKKGDALFQSSGYWRDIVCPTQYMLNGEFSDSHGTVSLIRGAIDGYAIGKKVMQLASKYGALRLSQILRMYYSGDSLPEALEMSVCSRVDPWNTMKTNLVEEAKMYHELHMLVSDNTVNDKMIISEYCNRVIGTIERNRAIFDDRVESTCATAPGSRKVEETPVDVIAVIDYQADEMKKQFQNEIIGNLSSGFQIKTDGSSVSVYTNLRPQGSDILNSIVNDSHISGCGSCRAKYFEPSGLSAESTTEVIKRLNRTLSVINEYQMDKDGVPAKVILHFIFQTFRQDHQLRHAIWELQYNNRETSLFAIGTDSMTLKQFVRDQINDVFMYVDGSTETLVEKLKNRVEKVPAQFIYSKCDQQDGSREGFYSGYISSYGIQYWAMYPKYFLKSYYITLTFTTNSGAYKVCFSRYYGDIFSGKPKEQLCGEVNSGKTFTRNVENPCYKRNVETCDPFYFYLEGMKEPEKSCEDVKCMNPKQIEFTFTHKGCSCNSATSLSSAFAMSIFFCIALIFRQIHM